MSEEPTNGGSRITHSLIVKIVGVVVTAAATAYFAHRESAQKELTQAQARWDTETADLILAKLERIEKAVAAKP